jgi:hypothetical protein
MKAIIPAGRKDAKTLTNKQLFPVYDRPMLLYPIPTLVDAGITHILLVAAVQRGRLSAASQQRRRPWLKHINYAFDARSAQAIYLRYDTGLRDVQVHRSGAPGVINRRIPDGYVTPWEQFEFLPRALDALRLWPRVATRRL